MIEFISGILIDKQPSFFIINVNGLGYRINTSINSFNNSPDKNKAITLLTYFSVSENNQELCGFIDETERKLFLLLISVSGIGPKTAMNLLSAVEPDDFKNRLVSGEVKLLTSLPGIGPKTARRIIVELKDKFIQSDNEELPIEDQTTNSDAFYALKSLGFKTSLIHETLNKITTKDKALTTEQIIKESLKKLK